MNTKPEVELVDEKKDYYTPAGGEHEEGVIETSALSIINAAEVSQQISTARRYPRSPTQFRRKVFELVTYNMDVAESCIYAIPRDGKMIDGPSIRFAENLQIAWGNCRSGTEVTDIGDEFVTAEGVFFDLESNSATKAKIMRRITTKTGKRFSADMIATTGNAACSIALRNAILRGIPKSLWYELFDEAKKVAGGTSQTFGARRDRVIKDLGIQGATPDMIFALLGVTGIEDLKTEHVVHLRGLQNAIKDGETTLEAAFAPREGEGKPGEAVPPRPTRSEFERKPAETDPKPKAEEPKTAQAEAAKPKDEPKRPSEEDVAAERAARRAEEWALQKEEWDAEFKTKTKIRELVDLRDAIDPQLDDAADKDWLKVAYETQLKVIKSEINKAKGGK